MEQIQADWATDILALCTDILALYHEKSKTFSSSKSSSSKLINENKCAVMKFLIDCTAQYVQLWWIGGFGEEVNTKSAAAVGEQLLGVVKRGQRLLQQCEKEDYAKSVIILGNAGEFCEIVDDVKRYCQMMNRMIERIVKFDPDHNPDKEELIKQLLDKVELDCSMLQNALTSAHKQDRNALIKDLKEHRSALTPSSSWFKWEKRNNSLSKRYNLSGLIGLLEGHMDPVTPVSIVDSVLIPDLTPLGMGAYGVVRKARWCEQPVAIKQFFHDPHFAYELQIFMKLMSTNYSHIVQIFGHSKLGDKRTLVMELMDMDLQKLIEQNIEKKKALATPAFSLYESTDLMLQIAKGMRDLHKGDVIHRDIKTSNILIKYTEDGSLTVKLSDFGISKADFKTKDDNTKMRGTKFYMAPEMADEDNYSRKIDVFSYGLVCMEILTGKPPNSDMQEGLKNGQMPSCLKGIPIPLYTIISNCLQLDKNKRPSFEEICGDLWNFKESILIRQDEVPSYIDERVLLNFRKYTETLGEECQKVMPPIFNKTPTGKRAIYCFWGRFFWDGVRHLPIDSLVDIELCGLSTESSGQIKFKQPLASLGNPFIDTGIEPQNHLSGNLQQDLGIFGQFKKLVVDQGKKLNLSFSIGGWNNSNNFSDAFSTDENRTRFINSVLELCRAYPIFNGLAIDWTFWSNDGVNYGKTGNSVRHEDAKNFVLVLEQLRSVLPRPFVIGITASRKPTKNKCPIDKRTSDLIDQIQLYYYDLSPGGETAHHFSPGEESASHRYNLYSSSHQNTSFDEAVKYYTSRGVESSKLFLGVGDYALGFSNADEIGQPAKPGLPDNMTGLCHSELVGHGFEEMWDDEAKAPYAYHPERRLICFYDNARSIKEKAEYIKLNNLGGIYIHHRPADCSLFKTVHDHLTHGTLPNTNNQA